MHKLNANTELREAYLAKFTARLSGPTPPDLLAVMRSAVAALQAVVVQKLQLFGSAGRASALD